MKYLKEYKLFEDIDWEEDWEEEKLYDFIVIKYKTSYWLVLHSKLDNKFYTFYDIVNKKHRNYNWVFHISGDIYVLAHEIGRGVRRSSSVKKEENINMITTPLGDTYSMDFLKILPNITYDSAPLWDYIKNEK